jgi:hypothetical protein
VTCDVERRDDPYVQAVCADEVVRYKVELKKQVGTNTNSNHKVKRTYESMIPRDAVFEASVVPVTRPPTKVDHLLNEGGLKKSLRKK